MTPPQRKVLLSLIKAGELLLCYVSMFCAYLATHHAGIRSLLELPRPPIIFLAVMCLGFVWQSCFEYVGLYKSHRKDTFTKELGDVVAGCLLATAFTALVLVLLHAGAPGGTHLSLVMSAWFALFATSVLLISHTIRQVTAYSLRRSGRNMRQVLILGTNHRATDVAHRLQSNASWGYNVLGFVDDTWWNGDTRAANERLLLGDLASLPELLRKTAVDEVILALPIASYYEQVAWAIGLCKQHGILVQLAGTFFDQAEPRHHLAGSGPEQTVTLHDRSWDAWGTVTKRALDLTVSTVLLLLLSPVLAVVALLIKISSPGPVFFVQTRLGRGKRLFPIYKFRTMVVNAETLIQSVEHLNQMNGPTFKLKNDPRITRIGSFLRTTSLDELPQLLNVLRGEMSLVGPRPLPLRDYEGFSEDWHRRRFSVKPGITCLWQITGRSSITFDQWMALDIRYIDHWSLWLDIKILALTIPAVLRGSGAV